MIALAILVTMIASFLASVAQPPRTDLEPSAAQPDDHTSSIVRVMRSATLHSLTKGAGDVGGGEHLCTLLLLGFAEDLKTCRNGGSGGAVDNTIEDCLTRVDFIVWERVLNPRCTSSAWWARKRNSTAAVALPERGEVGAGNVGRRDNHQQRPSASRLTLPQDVVRRSQTMMETADAASESIDDAPHRPHDARRRQLRQPRRAVPVHERTYATFSPVPLAAGDGLKVHGIGFAIPSALVRRSVSRHKFFDLNPSLPKWCCKVRGEPPTVRPPGAASQLRYLVGPDALDEYGTHQLMRHSYFAFSNRRGNYDCQRHTEIMSQGAVIFMPEMAWRCADSSRCLGGYPKALMREALSLPGIEHWATSVTTSATPSSDVILHKQPTERGYVNILRMPIINRTAFDRARYDDLARRMLNFTRHHLTCAALVAYMLRTMSAEEPRSVLLLVPEFMDYTSMAIECGFAELGQNYTTNPFASHGAGGGRGVFGWPPWQQRVTHAQGERFSHDDWVAAQARAQTEKMYGQGFVWSMRVGAPPNPRINDAEIDLRASAGEFDLVIVSNMFLSARKRWRTNLFSHAPYLLRSVAKAVPHNRIAFVDTEDYPIAPHMLDPRLRALIRNGSFYFMRELHALEPGGIAAAAGRAGV